MIDEIIIRGIALSLSTEDRLLHPEVKGVIERQLHNARMDNATVWGVPCTSKEINKLIGAGGSCTMLICHWMGQYHLLLMLGYKPGNPPHRGINVQIIDPDTDGRFTALKQRGNANLVASEGITLLISNMLAKAGIMPVNKEIQIKTASNNPLELASMFRSIANRLEGMSHEELRDTAMLESPPSQEHDLPSAAWSMSIKTLEHQNSTHTE